MERVILSSARVVVVPRGRARVDRNKLGKQFASNLQGARTPKEQGLELRKGREGQSAAAECVPSVPLSLLEYLKSKSRSSPPSLSSDDQDDAFL